MADDRQKPTPKGSIKGDLRRAERLAAELRSNLRKRKARVRTRNLESDVGKSDFGDQSPDEE
ncbi:MAG: hypothetical protein JSS20_05880 [Proteobacteria bacterium]|nr:hypothetical protein [Pseudomonadota bacterium]